ncbi:MAG: hypothetical protein R2856_10730 [Caldilineaceae bacterium]
MRRANKRGIIAGGEIPGYARYIRHMRAHDYIAKVVAGEPYDPTLNFRWSTASAVGTLKNYFHDKTTRGWASLIV